MMRRSTVLDKLRRLFGGGGKTVPGRPVRQRTGGAMPRRPAGPRTRPKSAEGGAAPASASASPSAKSGAPRSGSSSLTPPPEAGAEMACPNCGEPMLAGWGTTCGKCRPTMVAPKTLFMSASDLAFPGASGVTTAAGGMVLGWLVVLRSVDKARAGLLFDLEGDEVVLSRLGAFASVGARVVELDDVYMSGGHSVLRRPRTRAKTDAFTLRDRWDPGPSANGTFVNSNKLGAGEEMRLADGDIIKVGATELLFKSLWLPPPSGSRAS
jgi:FHA domain